MPPLSLLRRGALGQVFLGAGMLACFGNAARAQTLGTIEGALIGRIAGFHSSMQVGTTPTIGAQLTMYLGRPFALEGDASFGSARIDTPGSAKSVSFRPVSARLIWMPDPWWETRLLFGVGYTHYFFSGVHVPGKDAQAVGLTAGVQRDLRQIRLRLDLDLLGFEGRSSGSSTNLPTQLGGAVRASVTLRAPRACCS